MSELRGATVAEEVTKSGYSGIMGTMVRGVSEECAESFCAKAKTQGVLGRREAAVAVESSARVTDGRSLEYRTNSQRKAGLSLTGTNG